MLWKTFWTTRLENRNAHMNSSFCISINSWTHSLLIQLSPSSMQTSTKLQFSSFLAASFDRKSNVHAVVTSQTLSTLLTHLASHSQMEKAHFRQHCSNSVQSTTSPTTTSISVPNAKANKTLPSHSKSILLPVFWLFPSKDLTTKAKRSINESASQPASTWINIWTVNRTYFTTCMLFACTRAEVPNLATITAFAKQTNNSGTNATTSQLLTRVNTKFCQLKRICCFINASFQNKLRASATCGKCFWNDCQM